MSVNEEINCRDCRCYIDNTVETLTGAGRPRGCSRRERSRVYIIDKGSYLGYLTGCCDGTLKVEYIPGMHCYIKYNVLI